MSTSTDTRQRVAVVIYEDAAKNLARAYRGLMTALEFQEAGDDVTVVYDGSGEALGALSVAVHAKVPVETLRSMIYAYPTFHRGIEDALRCLERP